jgi:glycosyltransferase involved in cell wall biosynthesis
VFRKKSGIDIVHINEYTQLPVFLFARFFFKGKIIVHIRSVQRKAINSLRAKIIERIYTYFNVSAFICIDETVKSSMSEHLPVHLIHNGFAMDSKISEIDKVKSIPILRKEQKLIVGYIGNLLFLKGSLEFVQAAKICKNKNLDVKFIIVGYGKKKKNNKLLNLLNIAHDSTKIILDFIDDNQLSDIVELYDFTTNISTFYNYMDILCFPSYLNAAGRPVFEAAFHRKPSIVAIRSPFSDTIVDKETGLCINEKSAESIVDAVEYFYNNRSLVHVYGENAYQLALKHYDIKNNSLKMLKIYQNLIN